jgi:hypothetical protein
MRKKQEKEVPSFVSKLRSVLSGKLKYPLIIIGALLFFLFFKKVMILLIIGIILMVWDYFLHSIRFPIHFDGMLFVALLITKEYTFSIAVFFCLVVGNIAEILTGSFEASDILSVIPIILLCYISMYLPGIAFVLMGIIMSFAFFFMEMGLASLLAEPPHKVFAEPIAVLFINIFFFVMIGPTLLKLIAA